MLRSKNRFGSKSARDSRLKGDASEQNEGGDQAGSVLIDGDEGVAADQDTDHIDRYERSSDRYRAEANKRADTGKPVSARSSFGRPKMASNASGGSGGSFGSSFSKASSKVGKASSKTGLNAGQSAQTSQDDEAANPDSGQGFGSKSRSLISKAEAIKSANAELDGVQPDEPSEFTRSSDRTFPKKASSFGGGLSKRAATVKTSGDDVYERSSDRSKSGKSKAAGRSSLSASKASHSVNGEPTFQRSSDRRSGGISARVAAKHAIHDRLLQGEPLTASAQSRDNEPDESVGKDRVEAARNALEQASGSGAIPGSHSRTPDVKKNTRLTNASGFIDTQSASSEQYDPFEPFEQCAPAEPVVSSESTYSRGTPGRPAKRAATDSTDTNTNIDTQSKRKRPPLSLRGRALGYLSRREHSRAELARKLTRFLTEGDALEPLLDKLEQEGWLSNERFAESVIHRKGGRLGASRIVNELKRNGVDAMRIEEASAELKKTELARARDVWSRKFGNAIPDSPEERARQARFLAARGFASGTIMKVLNSKDAEFFEE